MDSTDSKGAERTLSEQPPGLGIEPGLADEIATRLGSAGLRLTSAESCTGGMVAACLTELPGSSAWFEGGFVTYSLSAKRRMLGVPAATLELHGAVSEPTARAMAEGALHQSDADLSVAITGTAGPDGGDVLVPVGTVWFAWAMRTPEIQCVQTAHHTLPGDRHAVRVAAVSVALRGVLELLS